MHVSEQQRNFELALVERLGVDPTKCAFEGWDTNGSVGWVNLKHIIDADELLQMWRDAAPPPPPLTEEERSRVHGVADGTGYVDISVGDVVKQPDGSYLLIEHKGGA